MDTGTGTEVPEETAAALQRQRGRDHTPDAVEPPVNQPWGPFLQTPPLRTALSGARRPEATNTPSNRCLASPPPEDATATAPR